MTPRRATHGARTCTRATIAYSSPSPPPYAQRSCTKRKVNYVEDDSNDDIEVSAQKRLRSSPSSDIFGTGADSPNSSPPSSPSPKPRAFGRSLAELENDLLYVEIDSRGAKIFRDFPIEIHQKIVSYLDTDREVARYALICKSSCEAISNSVWRERYERFFDVVQEAPIEEEMYGEIYTIEWAEQAYRLYKTRRHDTSCYTTFDSNVVRHLDFEAKKVQWEIQNKLLEQFKEMILDSNAKRVVENGMTKIVGKNFDFIRLLTSDRKQSKYCDLLANLLDEDHTICPVSIRRSRKRYEKDFEKIKAETLAIVQICLAPLILDPTISHSPAFHFDNSQRVVYSNSSNPLFDGKYKSKINTDLVLNTLNFFKFHLKASHGEGVLFDAYARLDADQYPQLWADSIPVGTQPLTGHWKGVSVFLDRKELRLLREDSSDHEIFSDAVDDDNLLDITFFTNEQRFTTKHWPQSWNTIMDSDPYSELDHAHPSSTSKRTASALPPKRPQVKEFWGTSRGLQTGHMFGRIHSVSNQSGFHGWQRVTMLKCFAKKDGSYDPDQLWMYEGVVLPGGRMIVGRWSDPRGNAESDIGVDSGPFIFWNVDRSTAVPEIEEDEAWKFGLGVDDSVFEGLFY